MKAATPNDSEKAVLKPVSPNVTSKSLVVVSHTSVEMIAYSVYRFPLLMLPIVFHAYYKSYKQSLRALSTICKLVGLTLQSSNTAIAKIIPVI